MLPDLPGISPTPRRRERWRKITRTLALEAIGHGIRVNAVGAGDGSPTSSTPFRDDGREFLTEHGKLAPIKRAAQPVEIARSSPSSRRKKPASSSAPSSWPMAG